MSPPQPSTFNFRYRHKPTTFQLQPSSFNLQPSTFNHRTSTFKLQASTVSLQQSSFRILLAKVFNGFYSRERDLQ
jgi:hypothetical protein